MTRRHAASPHLVTTACAIALAMAIPHPATALADTAGRTELTVLGTAEATADESGEVQERVAVAGKGGTPKTGDETTTVVSIVAAGLCLVLGGRAMRTKRDASLPVIPRNTNRPAGKAQEEA